MQDKLDQELSQEIMTLKGMLATISERNSQLEEDLHESVKANKLLGEDIREVSIKTETIQKDLNNLEDEFETQGGKAVSQENLQELESRITELKNHFEEKIDSIPRSNVV